MRAKVQFVTGLLSGFVLPGLMWLIFGYFYPAWVIMDKPAIPYLVSICVNLFVVRYFVKQGKENIGYGLIVSTFAVIFILFKLIKV